MSNNSRKSGLKLLVLGALILLSACDPCESLSKQICDCRYGDTEKGRICRQELNLAKTHKYFSNAKDTNICLRALQECPCDKLNDGDDRQCGMYRDLIPD